MCRSRWERLSLGPAKNAPSPPLTPGRLELVLTAYNKGYLARPQSVAYYQRFLREDLADHFKSRSFDDYTMIECNLLDADDGIHCIGMGGRYEDWTYIADDNYIGG